MLYLIKASETTGDLMAVSEESFNRPSTSNRTQDVLVRYKQSHSADRSVLPSIKRGEKYFLTKYLHYAMVRCKVGNHKMICI
jgi:hypothetical protein